MRNRSSACCTRTKLFFQLRMEERVDDGRVWNLHIVEECPRSVRQRNRGHNDVGWDQTTTGWECLVGSYVTHATRHTCRWVYRGCEWLNFTVNSTRANNTRTHNTLVNNTRTQSIRANNTDYYYFIKWRRSRYVSRWPAQLSHNMFSQNSDSLFNQLMLHCFPLFPHTCVCRVIINDLCSKLSPGPVRSDHIAGLVHEESQHTGQSLHGGPSHGQPLSHPLPRPKDTLFQHQDSQERRAEVIFYCCVTRDDVSSVWTLSMTPLQWCWRYFLRFDTFLRHSSITHLRSLTSLGCLNHLTDETLFRLSPSIAPQFINPPVVDLNTPLPWFMHRLEGSTGSNLYDKVVQSTKTNYGVTMDPAEL